MFIAENFDIIKSFDDITGPDILTLEFENIAYFGYIDKSPIEARLIECFSYRKTHTNYTKPYKAHWLISESKLLLLYCNGIVNGEKLYTTDMFPEFAGDDFFHFFNSFSGKLKFYSKQIQTPQAETISHKNVCIFLNFKDGVLIEWVFNTALLDLQS